MENLKIFLDPFKEVTKFRCEDTSIVSGRKKNCVAHNTSQ